MMTVCKLFANQTGTYLCRRDYALGAIPSRNISNGSAALILGSDTAHLYHNYMYFLHNNSIQKTQCQ